MLRKLLLLHWLLLCEWLHLRLLWLNRLLLRSELLGRLEKLLLLNRLGLGLRLELHEVKTGRGALEFRKSVSCWLRRTEANEVFNLSLMLHNWLYNGLLTCLLYPSNGFFLDNLSDWCIIRVFRDVSLHALFDKPLKLFWSVLKQPKWIVFHLLVYVLFVDIFVCQESKNLPT